jgi:transcriptional regulator with GAF, ATPase, and Fis domain
MVFALESGSREPLRKARMHETMESSTSLKSMVDAYERQLIQSALAAAAGNQRRAAAALGLLPTTLHEKMKRLGLLRRPAPRPEELAS